MAEAESVKNISDGIKKISLFENWSEVNLDSKLNFCNFIKEKFLSSDFSQKIDCYCRLSQSCTLMTFLSEKWLNVNDADKIVKIRDEAFHESALRELRPAMQCLWNHLKKRLNILCVQILNLRCFFYDEDLLEYNCKYVDFCLLDWFLE